MRNHVPLSAESVARGPRRAAWVSLLLGVCLAPAWAGAERPADPWREDFVASPLPLHSRPLWFWNGALDEAKTREMLTACKAAGYYGVGILPAQGMTPAFMTPSFLDHYDAAVRHAATLGLKLCLYDEYWFPSGAAGGLLARQYPEALSKRIDLLAQEATGPKEVSVAVPPGVFLGAVAMNRTTLERTNLTSLAQGGRLVWQAPAGEWKVMLFLCVRDGARELVDYLDPDAVRRFVSLTYEAYYRRFPTHFGTTIDSAFYDEPTFHWVEGGRAWTERFNEKFRAQRGFDPVPYYPALWFDIGPETAAARNALFGFRAELYSTGFPKTLNEWCAQHRVELTGHVDQEEIVNPVGLCGDLIRAFKYQDIPAIDQIFQYGRASKAYKIVSSAAYNYDRPRVLTECYGGIDRMPQANLYKEAMDQFAKGINMMVPHAVWYEPAKIIFQPDLSPASTNFGAALPEYNRYIGRLQRLLQGGRHVADIGVLYPIATLQADYRFGVGKPYEGGVSSPEADYMDVGEALALEVRRDFTFLHPETLDTRCRVQGAELALENPVNAERYRALVLPGARVIHASNLRKIQAFYEAGGIVIATTRLPEAAAGFGQDAAVRRCVATVFGASPTIGAGGFSRQDHPRGGRAYFLPRPSPEALRAILDEALPEGDVRFETTAPVKNGCLSYIHKVLDGRDVYFFGNSSDTAVDMPVSLRGRKTLAWWNPHTGAIEPAEVSPHEVAGQTLTRFRLNLPPVQSRFLVGPPSE